MPKGIYKHKFKNISGQKFGKLTVIKLHKRNNRKVILWLCKCDCGNEAVRDGENLKNKQHISSCGCLVAELAKITSTKHGKTKTRIYRIWSNAKQMCSNPKNTKYYNYGEKGIKIYNKWLIFENFWEDMGESYKRHVKKFGEMNTTLDRFPNQNGNYCPKNTRWATYSQQNSNHSKNPNDERIGKSTQSSS